VTSSEPTKIIPKSVLRIVDDPTLWGLADQRTARPGWTAPVQLQLVAPLAGTLVLSPARAEGFAIFPPAPGDGWMPGVVPGVRYLYLPTTAGVHSSSPFYELAPTTSVAQLADDIADAMRSGGLLTLEFQSVGQTGYVVLNGASLAFAVVG